MSVNLGPRASRALIAAFGRDDPASLVERRKTFVMLDVRQPLPRPLKGRKRHHNMRKVWAFPFVRLAGREWYWPSLVTLWRKGDDVSVQVAPVQMLRRWLFTRCEGCGERLPWNYCPVSRMEGYHAPASKSLPLGEHGCYHHDCAPDARAEWSATDSWDRQWGHDEYLRRTVLNEPPVLAHELAGLAAARREANQAYRARLLEARREVLGEFAWKVPRGQGFDAEQASTPEGGAR